MKNANVLVGRSHIVGSPLAHMLRKRGAVVTVSHLEVSPKKLESLVQDTDIVVSCAGAPGLLKADWVKEGAQVVNVGTTFMQCSFLCNQAQCVELQDGSSCQHGIHSQFFSFLAGD
mgnify:CR=1 FL=1